MQQINFQPLSKVVRSDGQSLLTHSIFYTIQGEGPHVGKPAVFVRLGGCNLQCPGCDTEYTAGAGELPVESIIERISALFGDFGGDERLVVITGGEPFRQSLEKFLNMLFEHNYSVQIETNGTVGFGNVTHLSRRVWQSLDIVVSPKAGKITPTLMPFIKAFKYVLDADHIDPADGLPTSVLGMPGAPARPWADYEYEVYVQPAEAFAPGLYADGRDHTANDDNLKAAIDSAMKFGYRLCLQTHKILGLE